MNHSWPSMTGEPIVGAKIIVQEDRRQTLSGQDGRFLFDRVKPGTYHLSVEAQGFSARHQEVTVAAPETIINLPAGIGVLPFIGTLFIFISFSSLLTVFPGYHPPTYSLSTTSALAINFLMIFIADGCFRLTVILYLDVL